MLTRYVSAEDLVPDVRLTPEAQSSTGRSLCFKLILEGGVDRQDRCGQPQNGGRPRDEVW